MKAKKSEITQLNTKIRNAKRRKRSTKAQMMDIRAEEENLLQLRKEHAALVADRLTFIVQARNTFVKTQLREEMQTNLPEGQTLEVHCVSNTHYASWKGAPLTGPRLSVKATGIPALRNYAFSLSAPGLLRTLDVYVGSDMQLFLKDLQLWTESTTVDRRFELLELVKTPKEKLGRRINTRTVEFAREVSNSMTRILEAKNTEAIASALKVLDNKQKKHPATVRAFIRKNGKYSTKICPKECWNENFSRLMSDLTVKQEEVLACAEIKLTHDLEEGLTSDLVALEGMLECKILGPGFAREFLLTFQASPRPLSPRKSSPKRSPLTKARSATSSQTRFPSTRKTCATSYTTPP